MLQAPWEESGDEDAEREDWTEFSNVVGYKELKRLQERDIKYRIPPPGAKIK